MSGETKRYDMTRGVGIASKREVFGNTYVIVLYPERDGCRSIYIYADTRDGSDHGLPGMLVGGISGYDSIVSYEDYDEPQSVAVAKALGRAVRHVERTLDNHTAIEESIDAAVDALEEAHENRKT